MKNNGHITNINIIHILTNSEVNGFVHKRFLSTQTLPTFSEKPLAVHHPA